MAATDYSVLDRADISQASFYPRRHWTPTPSGARDLMVTVADGVALSCRFHPAGRAGATLLFFYGNGEVVADYDGLAPLYHRLGINLLVADYRGYGGSDGSPSFSAMLHDAHRVLDAARNLLADEGFSGQLLVMGRSMGRHAAFELAANAPGRLRGLIVESGRATLEPFILGMDGETTNRLHEAYLKKIGSITIPTLVIHGEQDTLVPLPQAEKMYQALGSTEKRMVTIPGAGHNDLLHLGMERYLGAIEEFVAGTTSASYEEESH